MARQFNEQTQQELTLLQIEPVNIYDTLDATHIKRAQAKSWREMEWTKKYLEGAYPPHYPVPAIRIEIDIEPDMVLLWDYTNNKHHYLAVEG